MYRRRGRTLGTFVIGAFVLIAFAYALFGDSVGWRTMPSPVMKAEVSQSERSLAVGASVLAADGEGIGLEGSHKPRSAVGHHHARQ